MNLNLAFEMISSKYTWKKINADEALGLWKIFVDECKDGYSYSIFEYHNDLAIRTIIDYCINDNSLKLINELPTYEKNIFQIDNMFLNITLPNDYFKEEHWWMNKLPKCAGEDFVHSLYSVYKISDVTIC